MKNKSKQDDQEFSEIKNKLSEVQNDLKRFIEQSNKQQLELILANSRKDLSNAMISYVIDDAENSLANHMVKRCDMRETCRSKLSEILKNNAILLQKDQVNDKIISDNRSTLSNIQAKAPSKKCDVCLSEASNLFEKQVKLLTTLHIYNSNEPETLDISAIPEENVVTNVLEPISNKTRLQIIKALYYESKTFSGLSELTGLRAGNLLFHLQKLLNSGMVIQRHEGGDYMITDKGYKVLTKIHEIYETL